MKQWFPFTDYDFYAYLTAGMFLIAAIDYTIGDGSLINQSDWTVAQIVFWLAASYVAGQLVATPSSALLEHWVARRVFRTPADILLGYRSPRTREAIVRVVFAGYSYQAMPLQLQNTIKEKAAAAYETSIQNLTGEAIFQAGFSFARRNIDAAARIDQLRNVYAFNRNLTLVSLIASALAAWRAIADEPAQFTCFAALALVVAAGCFGRFMKFYSSYTQEVLSRFAFQPIGAETGA